MVNGRTRIGSDPYFALSQANGYIGLLDTGVRFTHVVFNSPSNIGFRFDCTDGTCDDNPDVDDRHDHGTRTAAIITGNNRLGNAFRGVTGITLDSFKVYPSNRGRLNYTATTKAFQRAVAILDRVIVAEMQSGENDTGSISRAADRAYDAGAVIIAANGNNERAAELLEPGEKVLIKSGVYREWIKPAKGGSGADKMISYEVQPHCSVLLPTYTYMHILCMFTHTN